MRCSFFPLWSAELSSEEKQQAKSWSKQETSTDEEVIENLFLRAIFVVDAQDYFIVEGEANCKQHNQEIEGDDPNFSDGAPNRQQKTNRHDSTQADEGDVQLYLTFCPI